MLLQHLVLVAAVAFVSDRPDASLVVADVTHGSRGRVMEFAGFYLDVYAVSQEQC